MEQFVGAYSVFVFDEVDVSALGTEMALLGAIPALCEAVECADEFSSAVEDGDFHRSDIGALDDEVLVRLLSGSENVGNPEAVVVEEDGVEGGVCAAIVVIGEELYGHLVSEGWVLEEVVVADVAEGVV